MSLEAILLEGFSSSVLRKLTKQLRRKCAGSLEGGPYREPVELKCSVKATGRRAFVIKGWVDTERGPVVKFRAAWGELADGEMFWQESPKDQGEELYNEDIDLKITTNEIKLSVKFERDPGESFTARFWTTYVGAAKSAALCSLTVQTLHEGDSLWKKFFDSWIVCSQPPLTRRFIYS